MPATGARDRIRGGLPSQLTSFIGRDRELRQLRELLDGSRLLTLTGAGGSGKTRLGLRLVEEVSGEFADGVFFVPLAPVGSPELVLSSIAHSIGLRDSGDRPLADRLADHLVDKQVLLLLDNFEHLIAAAPMVTWVLRATAAVRIVVTSRRPLRVTGEQEYEVAPLPVPTDEEAQVREIVAVESVRLFTERAQATSPGFALDQANAPVVAAITRRLDGLPLAIELAAARIKLLPPASLLARLEHALPLLVGGPKDLAPRQQTLLATIAWSHGLLDTGAQRLFAVCSVFRGGIGLSRLEPVCAGSIELGVEALTALEELVDHSLLRPVGGAGDPRFAVLETVREYAADRLSTMPEAAAVKAGHAATFLALAVAAEPELRGPGEREGLDRLEAEHQNLRAALTWYKQHAPGEALRLAAALSRFWAVRGHFTEGRQRLSRLLYACPEPTASRVRALTGAALLAIDQGDYDASADLLDESIRLARALDDVGGEATALVFLGRSFIARGRPAEGVVPVERAVRLLDRGRDPALGLALLYAGLAAQFTGRLEEAASRYRRSVAVCRDVGWRSLGARSLQLLGHVLLELGDIRAARAALEKALPTCIDVGDRWVVPIVMVGFAGVAARTGRPRRALTLAGAADGLCAAGQFSMPPVITAELERWVSPARAQLGRESERALAAGRRMSESEAVAYALADEPEPPHLPGPRPALTPREVEVATLVAQGLTNRSVAARLHVSTRTVDTHVDHLLAKLGFHRRTQLGAWAYEAHLLPRDR